MLRVSGIMATAGFTLAALVVGMGASGESAAANAPGRASGGATVKSVAERTRWMAEGSYGMMVHYLLGPAGETQAKKTEELNRIIDGFDIDFFMKQFRDSGADWLIFTIGQNTGYYNSPNAFLDSVLPGRTPKRDLVLEIAQRVKKMGKRFIAYLPVEMWMQQPDMQQAFGWNPDDQTQFLRNYLTFVTNFSTKLGANCDGWWFDGCYEQIHKGKWGWRNWCKAAQTGNPDTIIAFNDGAFCVGRMEPVTKLQDYHAGEVHLLEDGKIRIDPVVGGEITFTPDGKFRRQGQEPKFHMPTSRFLHGVQWHALVPVDSSFVGELPLDKVAYSTDELVRFVSDCKRVQGAVTLNVPIDGTGHIPAASAAKLAKLGKALRK